MVRNTKGGTGTKALARKHQNDSGSGKIRLPECDLEIIAYVAKMYGNGMCEIISNDNTKLIGHIRNKFRGRQKRHNTISPNSVVLVGLREWETTHKNCDILYIYDDSHIKLISDMPSLNISNIINNIQSTDFSLYNNNNNNNYNNSISFTSDFNRPNDDNNNNNNNNYFDNNFDIDII